MMRFMGKTTGPMRCRVAGLPKRQLGFFYSRIAADRKTRMSADMGTRMSTETDCRFWILDFGIQNLKSKIQNVSTFLPSQRGQVTLEYFILFAAVTLIAIAGLTSSGFWGQLAKTVEDFVNAAATKIAQ